MSIDYENFGECIDSINRPVMLVVWQRKSSCDGELLIYSEDRDHSPFVMTSEIPRA